MRDKKIMKNKLNVFAKFGVLASSVLAPFVLFAQTTSPIVSTCSSSGSFDFVLCKISLWLNTIVPILITLGVIYFIWGVISYAIAKDDEAKGTGRANMINGLIALLVIVSIWGLINMVKNAFGVPTSSTISVPCIPAPGVSC